MLLFPDAREQLLDLMPKRAVVCEIGVAEGQYSQEILNRTSPLKLHLIDPWVFQEREDYQKDLNNVSNEEGDQRFQNVTAQFQAEISTGQVEIHREFSYDVVDQFPDGYFDWIYVDAVHSYEGAKQDLLRFLPKVKEDGFIFGHDYANHLAAKDMEFGVVEAVDEFCLEKNLHFIALTNEAYPSFLLSRNKKFKSSEALIARICARYRIISAVDNHPHDTVMQQDLFEIDGKFSLCNRFTPRK